MAGYHQRNEPAPLFTESVLVMQVAFWLIIAGAGWWLGRWGAAGAAGCMMLATFSEVRRMDLRLLQLLNLGTAGWVLFRVF